MPFLPVERWRDVSPILPCAMPSRPAISRPAH